MKKINVAGAVAVVTGGGGGIGRAIAGALARRGCNLAIADIDEAGLAATARQCGAAGGGEVRVTCHRLDVADAVAVAALPGQVLAAHGQVDIVVNNAGVALGGSFAQVSETDFDWLIGINFQGVVRMTRAFLPLLQARDCAQLVNLSSLFGLIAPPGQTAYCAAKFAVRGFSEALRNELLAAQSTVGVTVVHPGGIKTAIATNARLGAGISGAARDRQISHFNKALKMPPERAGEIIVTGLIARRARVLVGNDAKIAALVERLLPVNYWRLLGRGV